MAAVTVWSLLQTTYYFRWFTAYSPPDHFGNFQGAVNSMCGILSFLVCSALESASAQSLSGLKLFLLPLAGLFVANTASSMWFCCHILAKGLPEVPPHIEMEKEVLYTKVAGDDAEAVR